MDLKLYQADGSGEASSMDPLLSFTMNKGETFLIFECAGDIFTEEKKHFHNWRTVSNLRVSPHRHMKKFHSCEFCPYEKR